ncbi:MAG: chorismate synthase, partial [Bacteroidetes bacterium]|nr:chorismate synthase [Bacteroidota bacterium]
MIRFLTAGESHGKAVTVIAEGFPSNLPIKKSYIDFHLKRRQQGYGRGGRMKIESDAAEILSGLRNGKTLGSPISMLIKNKDWVNWKEIMDAEKISVDTVKINIPRPGHADLVGISKYDFDDIRNSIERSSARETAARVAAGTIARKYLEEFGINVGSYVESIGDIFPKTNFTESLLLNNIRKDFNAWHLSKKSDQSDVRVLDDEHQKKIINKIKTAKKRGDTLGGSFIVVASGVPVGLGTFMHYDRRLDAGIASAIMSINAVKGVDAKQEWRYEWLELRSTVERSMVLERWSIELYRPSSAKAMEGKGEELYFQIPLQGIIPSNGYLLVGASDKILGVDVNYANLGGKFVNSGMTVLLKDNLGNVVDEVDARKGWPAGENE